MSGFKKLPFPAFGLGWTPAVDDQPPLLLLAGGGGSAKTGVPNSVTAVALEATDAGAAELRTQAMLDTGDELVAHIAVAPKGGLIAAGMLASCHLLAFSAGAASLVDLGAFQTDFAEEPFENALAFNAAGDRVASGGDDGVVRVWHVRNRGALVRAAARADEANAPTAPRPDVARVCEARGHAKPVTDVAFAKAGALVASTSRDGTCRVWNAASGAQLAELASGSDVKGAFFRACAFTDADDVLAVHTGPLGPAVLTQFAAQRPAEGAAPVCWTPQRVLRLSKGPVCAMSAGAATVLAFGSNDGSILVVDAVKFRVWQTKPKAHHLPVTGVALVPPGGMAGLADDQPRVVSVSADSTCHVLAVSTSPLRGTALWVLLALLAVLVGLAWVG